MEESNGGNIGEYSVVRQFIKSKKLKDLTQSQYTWFLPLEQRKTLSSIMDGLQKRGRRVMAVMVAI